MGVLDRIRRRPALTAAGDFRALVAAGQRIDLSQKKAVQNLIRRRDAWQEEAFAYWAAIAELKQASRFQGDVLSRASFFPAVITPDSDMPVPIELADGVSPALKAAALDEMARLGDFNQLIKRLVTQWQVPGEGYLIGREEDGEEIWEIASRSQLFVGRNDTIQLRYTPQEREGIPLNPAQDIIVRLWQEDAQWPGMADSPMKGLLYEIEEVLILGRMIRSVGRSRLANGSILTIPSELSYGPGEDLAPPDGTSGAQSNRFVDKVQQTFIEPIHDEGSAAAIAPIIIEGAHRYLDKVKYLPMPREIDPVIDGRIDKLFIRFARAWNLPPERLLGMSGTTFANASQIERNEWDAHLAPLGEGMGLAVAKGWLRSALIERGFSRADVRVVIIAVDPARAVTNPTIASDAKDAHKALAISNATFRRALGFDEGDAPDEEELAWRIAAARGSVDSNITSELLAEILREVLGREPASISAPSTEPKTPEEKEDDRGPRPEPPASGDGGQDIVPREKAASVDNVVPFAPAAGRLIRVGQTVTEGEKLGAKLVDLDVVLTQRILVAMDAATQRALEKAGSRLRAAVQSDKALAASIKGVPSEEVGLRAGREVLTRFGLNEDRLVAGVFEDHEARYDRWVGEAQREAIALIAAFTHWTDARTQATLHTLGDMRKRSWGMLVAALMGLVRVRLFENVVAPGPGEWDETLLVPPAYVRGALAVAGGEVETALGQTLREPRGGRFTGGAAFGAIAHEALTDDGVEVREWVWRYGVMPRTSFPPHVALDGKRFRRAADDALLNQEAFPHFGAYFPGDHAGCACVVVPVFSTPAFSEAMVASSQEVAR